MRNILDSGLEPVPLSKIEELIENAREIINPSRLDLNEIYKIHGRHPILWKELDADSQDSLSQEKIKELKIYDFHSISILSRKFSPTNFLKKIQKLHLKYSNAGMSVVDSYYESSVQIAATKTLAKQYSDGLFVQVGGNGTQALKHLLLGSGRSFLVTPSLGEAIVATLGASDLNVLDRFTCILGVGENLPLLNESVDVVYYGGSLHHTNHIVAIKEATRVIKNSGILLALEAIETLGYRNAIRILKKREPDVDCVILTRSNLKEICFEYPQSEFVYGGFLLRYIFLGLQKLRFKIPKVIIVTTQVLVDKIAGKWLRSLLGSSVLILIPKNKFNRDYILR